MTTQKSGTPPDNWRGSKVAFVAFEALVRAGKQPGRDFSYQPRTQGARIGMGSDIDFMFRNPPDLAMNIKEPLYSNYNGIETHGTDVLAKAQLASQGVTLIMLDHEKLTQDADWVIGEALKYRDHSLE